jgi:hypothetical protein
LVRDTEHLRHRLHGYECRLSSRARALAFAESVRCPDVAPDVSRSSWISKGDDVVNGSLDDRGSCRRCAQGYLDRSTGCRTGTSPYGNANRHASGRRSG